MKAVPDRENGVPYSCLLFSGVRSECGAGVWLRDMELAEHSCLSRFSPHCSNSKTEAEGSWERVGVVSRIF